MRKCIHQSTACQAMHFCTWPASASQAMPMPMKKGPCLIMVSAFIPGPKTSALETSQGHAVRPLPIQVRAGPNYDMAILYPRTKIWAARRKRGFGYKPGPQRTNSGAAEGYPFSSCATEVRGSEEGETSPPTLRVGRLPDDRVGKRHRIGSGRVRTASSAES